jgi:hypothetical protein
MRLSGLSLAAILLTAGCSAYSNAPPATGAAPSGICDAEPALSLIGVKASAEVGAEIKRLTSSEVFQWVPEGTPVTMDYRIERVRVTYDSTMSILSIRCG